MAGLSTLSLVEIAAPALVVAVSPIPVVIVLVLLVHNDRPRVSSIAYLLGRSSALAILVAAFVAIPWLGEYLYRPLPGWTDWIALGVGAALVALGIRAWRRRAATSTPKWSTQIGGIPPMASVALGLIPPLVAPRIIAASMAAGGQMRALSTTLDTVVAVGWFVVLATLTVTAPIVVYLALGRRIDARLDRLRHWIHDHRDTVTATMFTGVGLLIALYALS